MKLTSIIAFCLLTGSCDLVPCEAAICDCILFEESLLPRVFLLAMATSAKKASSSLSSKSESSSNTFRRLLILNSLMQHAFTKLNFFLDNTNEEVLMKFVED